MGNLKQRFGGLVAAHRRRLGWKQRQLAEAADLSDDFVARIELGNTGVTFATIEKLAAALQVDPAELFSTDLPLGGLQRKPLSDLTVKLAALKPDEIAWIIGIVDAALKRKP